MRHAFAQLAKLLLHRIKPGLQPILSRLQERPNLAAGAIVSLRPALLLLPYFPDMVQEPLNTSAISL